MLEFVKILSLLLALIGILVLMFGYIRYLLILPQGAFKIFQYWWMKDYFSPEEWVEAKKCFKLMFSGLLMVVLNVLFLLMLK